MQDLPIYRSANLPDGSGRIVLYDWSAKPEYRFRNLVCLDGGPIWKAMLPDNTGPDFFVDFTLDGLTVRANTWSGYLLTLDPKTGETLTCIFVK
jgi:outer membrane protein assembly factor BamB